MSSVPPIDVMTDDDRAALRAEFGHIMSTIEETPTEETPRRRRGRPPGSRNKPKPADYAPVGEDLPTLATPPMTTRDQREVAKRLAGILTGLTGVAATAKPYLQMTDEEAEAISVPLTSYLIRTESTSQLARQVLDEYDVAAFVIALAAYVVRVYRDFREERKQISESRQQPDNVRRESVAAMREDIREDHPQTQVGEERSINRELATVPEIGWTPSSV